jgi:pimeloyl-ACP methyl ester carboxylesterase
MTNIFRNGAATLLLVLTVAVFAAAQKPAVATGKAPVIIIPGLTGSDLYNSKTGEEVWFRSRRAKDDDIRLPISANLARNRDDLVTRDIIRSVRFLKILPEAEIYERLIAALETRGGYHEAKWSTSARRDASDSFYVFPYDWRRDNVENAQLLIRRIETLKRRLGKPNLKFNIIAHSMGGLIARYAAMYGDADIPAAGAKPTWAGVRHMKKVFLLGTPNEGSVMALNALLNGFSYIGGGLNLPFIQNITRFDVFTLPSAFQLLPHPGTLLAYDEQLKPMAIDLYDPAVWEKYGWSIWLDDGFGKKFSAIEQKNARPYFQAVLARAKAFQTALDANGTAPTGVGFYLIGANCKETPTALLLIQDSKGRWETRFKADGFTRRDGTKVSDAQLKPLLFANGDSVVTKRSLATETLSANGQSLAFPVAGELFQCEGHSKLVTNPEVQDKLLVLLNGGTVGEAEAAGSK